MKTIMLVLVTIAILFYAWFITVGLDKQEVYECNQWMSQAQEYNGFFLTHWQNEQCRAHNIIINAPIK